MIAQAAGPSAKHACNAFHFSMHMTYFAARPLARHKWNVF
jgi:hypothetical protein